MSALADIKFKFPKGVHKYPLTKGEIENFKIRPRQPVCDWAEENLTLIQPSYLYPGHFKAWKFQREPINAFNYWERIIYVGAVQTFKSGITDLQAYYSMSVLGLNGMIAYTNEKKVLDAFEDRYVPMIKSSENTVLCDQWDGKDDSLTKNKLKLNSCTWKIASANNKDDMASFTAPITIGSEVAKWRQKRGLFNPIVVLRGRSGATFAMGGISKNILESSPFEIGDLLYQEVFREGTLILQPHYKCPHCDYWQTFTDYQIKLVDEELKGKPAKIRELKEDSVYYECIECKEKITEAMRARMAENVIWAMPEIETDEFKQLPEKIKKDGSINGRREGGVRLGYDTVCYWWNRLADVSFSFYKCIAEFFETLHDDERKKSYENETMARWWKRKTGRIEERYLETRKLKNYFQWGDNHRIPDTVLVITLGIDSQDNGFYYSYVGWGQWLSWIVLRQGFIPCPRVEKGYEYEVFDKLTNHLYIEPLCWQDGTHADLTAGLIDRGGHRPDDVDFIVKHFPGGRLHAYVGLTQRYEDRSLIYKSDKGDYYLGQADALSEDTGAFIAGESFWLPYDVDEEFTKQIGRQFHMKKTDAYGRVKVVWVHNYQGPDHYRDTLNLNYAVAKIKNIDKMLLNPMHCETIRIKRKEVCPVHKPNVPKQQKKKIVNRNYSRTRSTYFNNAMRGRLR